ncbi:MAG TPA: hypothetical protein VGC45_15465 [Gryllotalpicola sp.]
MSAPAGDDRRTPPWPDPEWDRVSPAPRGARGRHDGERRPSVRPATVVITLSAGMAAAFGITLGAFLLMP